VDEKTTGYPYVFIDNSPAHVIERVTSLLQCALLTLTLCSSTAKLVLLQLSHELVSILMNNT